MTQSVCSKLFIVIILSLITLTSSFSSAEPAPVSKADWPSPIIDTLTHGLLLVELLEYRLADNDDSFNWDVIGWRGGDTHRLWFKTEGSSELSSPTENESDFQLLYGRAISPFFDLQIGPRLERTWGAGQSASRLTAAIGLQGLMPYRFELEAAAFFGEAGHAAARITATKDFLFTQKSIAQFRFETNGAVKRSDKFETGSGINDLSLGLRLRYELKREIAPYVGVSWGNLFGETADFRKQNGGEISEVSAVAGLRLWY